MGLLNTIHFIVTHPLGRKRPLTALARFARWQVTSRAGTGAAVVPFAEDACLLVSRGMTGATGNIYVGLQEYEDMAFLLHLLRAGDLFVDIGANVGVYTILAAKVVGAACVAIEPMPDTFSHLEDNVQLNRVQHLVDARCIGLAATPGRLRFSADLDTMNHVVDENYKGRTRELEVVPLDGVLGERVPLAIKMDVEGFEREVLRGAARTLANPGLKAVVLELNDMQDRYVSAGETTAAEILNSAGFHRYRYDPASRRLISDGSRSRTGNDLFVRDRDLVDGRLASARRYRVGPWTV